MVNCMKKKTDEPASFIAGESVEWTKNLPGYLPKDGWDLFYAFRNFGAHFDIAAIKKEDHYLIRMNSEQSAVLKPANYWWQATVTKGNDWHVVDAGSLEIKEHLSLADSYDGRSHVKKVLDALEAMILDKASRDQQSYSIAGRSLYRLSPAELLKWRDHYKAEYARELQAELLSKGLGGNLIKVRF